MGKQDRRRSQPTEAKAVIWQRIVVLPISAKEGRELLTEGQYLHVKDQLKQLVGFGARSYESELRISPFEEFWELKEKGGVLGRKNMRIYFFFDSEANDVIVLHTDKKEDDGMACPDVKFKLRNRLRLYRTGRFEGQLIYYSREQ